MIQIDSFLEKHSMTFYKNHSLKKYNTWRIGGTTSYFINVKTVKELSLVIPYLKQHNLSYFIIGNGSNLLLEDKHHETIFLKLGDEFNHFESTRNIITIGASHSLIRASTLAAKKGLSGLEFAGGIPATIGGAIVMNAGAHGTEMKDLVIDVTVLTEDGKIKTLNNKSMHFQYRSSILKEKKWIVLKVRLKLSPSLPEAISEKTNRFRERRLSTQPLREPSCGSVFQNPKPYFAAKLIEDLDLKGFSIGGAEISKRHANFIVNKGNATSDDIQSLISMIQSSVYHKHGIELKTEVIRI